MLRRLDEENQALNRQVSALQKHYEQAENSHSDQLSELAKAHRLELESQADRFRDAAQNQEKTLEARERLHKQRLNSYEEQIEKLKAQLGAELRIKRDFLSTVSQKNDEMRDLRTQLDGTLQRAVRDVSPGERMSSHSARLRGSLQNIAQASPPRAQSPMRAASRASRR